MRCVLFISLLLVSLISIGKDTKNSIVALVNKNIITSQSFQSRLDEASTIDEKILIINEKIDLVLQEELINKIENTINNKAIKMTLNIFIINSFLRKSINKSRAVTARARIILRIVPRLPVRSIVTPIVNLLNKANLPLFIKDKRNGNILRITDIFDIYKKRKRTKVKPVGFLAGSKNIYLTTDDGNLLTIDIYSGKTIIINKIDNRKLSRPFILNKNLFIIKDNYIVKMN